MFTINVSNIIRSGNSTHGQQASARVQTGMASRLSSLLQSHEGDRRSSKEFAHLAGIARNGATMVDAGRLFRNR